MKADYAGVGLTWASASDAGRVRSLNEDSLVAQPPVFAVADGMGGHEAGEIASALTIQRLTALADREPPDIDAVAVEFQSIHESLRNASVGGRSVDMGTTAVSLMVVRNGGVLSWLVVNIGDSRMYSVSDNAMEQVTNDHSYVQELVDAGELDPEEIRSHPQKNIVTQALGAIEVARPDFWIRPIRSGERFLLCSDGLTGELDDSEIASVLLSDEPPDSVVAVLTDRALDHGGRDNISIIVVDVDSVPSALEESTDTNPATGRREIEISGTPEDVRDDADTANLHPVLGPEPIGDVPDRTDQAPHASSGGSGGEALIDLVPGADQLAEPEPPKPAVSVSVIERMPDALLDGGADGDE